MEAKPIQSNANAGSHVTATEKEATTCHAAQPTSQPGPVAAVAPGNSQPGPARTASPAHKPGKRQIGAMAEQAVARYLRAQGFYLRQSNYEIPRIGEIDLIMQRGRVIYFIEVKARQNNAAFGGGLAAITAGKRRRLQRTALIYLQHERLQNSDFAFLAAEVTLDAAGQAGAIHIVPVENF